MNTDTILVAVNRPHASSHLPIKEDAIVNRNDYWGLCIKSPIFAPILRVYVILLRYCQMFVSLYRTSYLFVGYDMYLF